MIWNRAFPSLSRWGLILLSFLFVAALPGCSSGDDDDDDASQTSGDDDSSPTGDDDSSPTGDDDSSPTGDDDATENDDGGGGGDDDSSPTGDDDAATNSPTPVIQDADGDSIPDEKDNCPEAANADQADGDQDGLGDVCDTCPTDPEPDEDGDGLCGDADPCPLDPDNDIDADGLCGDVDNCPDVSNADQSESDGDEYGDACDPCPDDTVNDPDQDGICAAEDNCPETANSDQMDRDQDGVGDLCDPCPDDAPDDDEDGECGPEYTPNPDGSFYIYGLYPSDGAQAVLPDLLGSIYFIEPYEGDEDLISITFIDQDGATQSSDAIMTSSGDEARFYAKPDLKEDTNYCLMVEVPYQEDVDGRWPIRASACFTTAVPCGVTIDVGASVSIDQLGDSTQAQLNVINGWLSSYGSDYPVVFLLQDVIESATFSEIATFSAALGAYETDADGNNVLETDGYVSSIPDCVVDETGDMLCSADDVVFPLYDEETNTKINLFVKEVSMSGTLLSSGALNTISSFVLDGIVTQDSLRILENTTGFPIGDYVELDVDTDGDGTMDAATFVLSTSPQPLDLLNASCSEE